MIDSFFCRFGWEFGVGYIFGCRSWRVILMVGRFCFMKYLSLMIYLSSVLLRVCYLDIFIVYNLFLVFLRIYNYCFYIFLVCRNGLVMNVFVLNCYNKESKSVSN